MKKDLDQILSRGVSELIGEKDLRAKLENEPEKVVIKYGVDPTRPDLHLGHAVCLRKLREFQNLGCKIVFLIGDFTAQIGDPTGKDKTRPNVKPEEIAANVNSYLEQIPKILITKEEEVKKIKEKDGKIGDFEVVFNFDWYRSMHDFLLGQDFNQKLQAYLNEFNRVFKMRHEKIKGVKLTGKQEVTLHTVTIVSFFRTLSKLTHSRLIERDMFQQRIKNNEPIFLNEMLYPVIQGIDSYVIANVHDRCDLELGGTDQHFNMLMGREVMEMNNQKPQAVMTLPILEGTDGKEKMSKSADNYIGITESPTDIFGKTMRIPDELISRWVELCTDLDSAEFEKKLKKGNPRDLKAELAQELVRIYHGDEAAKKAPEEFARMFSGKDGGGKPDEIPEVRIEEGSWGIVELLANANLISSKSEGRRLIEQGGVKVNDKKVESVDENFEVGKGELILQVGKRKWAKLVS